MAVTDILIALSLIVLVLGALGLAMWIIYRIGIFIAFNIYGERLGLAKEGMVKDDN